MNVQNTEARNVFRERSEQGVSAVPGSLAHRARARTRARARVCATSQHRAHRSKNMARLGILKAWAYFSYAVECTVHCSGGVESLRSKPVYITSTIKLQPLERLEQELG